MDIADKNKKELETFPEIDLSDFENEKETLKNLDRKMKTYLNDGGESPFCFLNVFKSGEDIKELTEKLKNPSLKYIFLAGMGGSILGTRAIYDALLGYYANMRPKKFPKMIFLDNVYPNFLEEIKKFVKENVENKEEVVFLFVSKSGETIETKQNADFLTSLFEEKFENINDRVCVITTKESAFEKMADEKGFNKIFIPKELSGRFSVFSAVSLLPLSLCGFDIDNITKGAEDAREEHFQNKSGNLALRSSIFLFKNKNEGKDINVEFFWNPELETLGRWVRQLKSESLGKRENKDGEVVREGITTMTAIGPRDLHSLFQLIVGGPKDKVLNSLIFSMPSRKKRDGNYITRALYKSVLDVYKKEGVPFSKFEFDKDLEYALGWFMQFRMIGTVYLAELMGVDAFDQPSVEEYKNIVKDIIS